MLAATFYPYGYTGLRDFYYERNVSTGMEVEVVDDLVAEPVSLSDAKVYLKIDSAITDEDDLITALIRVSRLMCEGYSGLSFGEKTLTLYMANHTRYTKLPYGPVAEVDSVTLDGTAGILDQQFEVSDNNRLTVYRYGKNLTVTYTTKALAAQPNAELYKQAIKAQLAFLYEHRGDEIGGQVCELAQVILAPVKVLNVF